MNKYGQHLCDAPNSFGMIVGNFISRSILHGYFNPLVFWYQWEYLPTSKEFTFFAGYLRLAMIFGDLTVLCGLPLC